MTLEDVSSWLNLACFKDSELSGVCIDSRQVQPGSLFVAIRGDRFDGHDFILQAEAQGAAAVVCQQAVPGLVIPQLVVADTVQALAIMGRAYRQTLSCAVIALTGSNGKTTVKEMIAAMLPKPAFATPGNLNNHIGAPLSVLSLLPSHRFAVFELGASHLGEIAHTVAVVQPHVTLINNIAPAHIEGFGSIDGVAHAKGEIHQGLGADGTAVINDDDAYAHFWDPLLSRKKIIRFSASHAQDVSARAITFTTTGCAQFVLITPQGEASVQLRVPGQHNLQNALAASACAHALGIALVDIVLGLHQFSGVSGRMTFLSGKKQACIIDDTYNANLSSALTALDVLAKHKGRRIFVFGDMGELGSFSKQHHEQVGIAALEQGIDRVMTCGTQSQATAVAFGVGARHYDSQEALLHDLIDQLDATTTVLVKGSRSSEMEKIVHRLVA